MGQREDSLRLYKALANAPDLQNVSPQPNAEAVDLEELVRLLGRLTAANASWPSSLDTYKLVDLALQTLSADEPPFEYNPPPGYVCTAADLWRDQFKRDSEFNPSPWEIVFAPETPCAGTAEFLLADHWEALFEIRSRHGSTFGPPIGRFDRSLLSPAVGEAHRFLADAFEKDRRRTAHLFALGALYQDAQLMIRQVLMGQDVTMPVHLREVTRAKLDQRRIVEESSTPPLFSPWILELIREDPCPFWLCQECRRVFISPVRGKRPIYCSPACRARGIPSAAFRSTYMRRYRKRKTDEEVAIARIALQGIPTDLRLAALRRRFPEKSGPQVRALLQRVDTPPAEVNHDEEKPK